MAEGTIQGQGNGAVGGRYDGNAVGNGANGTRDEILSKLLYKQSQIVFYSSVLNYGESGQILLKDTYCFFYELILEAGKNPSLDIKTMLESALQSNQINPDVKLGANFLKEFSDNQEKIKGLNKQRLFHNHKTFQDYIANNIREVTTKYPRRCIEWHEKALNLALHFNSFAAGGNVAAINAIYEKYCVTAKELKRIRGINTAKEVNGKNGQNPLNGMKQEVKQIILEAKNSNAVKSSADRGERLENIREFLTENYSRFPKIKDYLESQSSNYKNNFIIELTLLISRNYGKINEIFLATDKSFGGELVGTLLKLEKMRVYDPSIAAITVPGEYRINAREEKAAKVSGSPVINETNAKGELETKMTAMARLIRKDKKIMEAKPEQRGSAIRRKLDGVFGKVCQSGFIEKMAIAIETDMETKGNASADKGFSGIKALLNVDIKDIFKADVLPEIAKGSKNIFDTKGKATKVRIPGK